MEIITSDKFHSRREWLNKGVTAKAKSSIKASIKAETKNRIEKGKKILEEELSKLNLKPASRIFKKLLPGYEVTSKDELYSKIGSSIIKLDDLKKILKKNTKNKWIRYWQIQFAKSTQRNKKPITSKKTAKKDITAPVLLKENIDEEQPEYTIAKCCNPIPGDDVIGYTDTDINSQVTIHRKKCPNAIKLLSSHKELIVPVKWTTHKVLSFLVKLAITGIDHFGIYNDITTVISKQLNVNIRTINLASHDGIWEGTIDLYVHDTKDVNNLIMNLSKIKGVDSVTRVETV